MKKLFITAACVAALSTGAFAQANQNSNNPTSGKDAMKASGAQGSATTGTGSAQNGNKMKDGKPAFGSTGKAGGEGGSGR